MAQRNVSGFKAVKDSDFADNITGQITALKTRNILEDIGDSFLNKSDEAYTSFVATAAGTNAYTATLNPAITAYASTQRYLILFTNGNTAASTLNLNALGVKSIVKNGATALASGDIAAGQIYLLAYDGTNLQIVGKVGGGVTNTAAANEVMKSDGTNAIPSGIFSATSANLTLGSASIAGGRTIAVSSLDAAADLTLTSQGASAINLTTALCNINAPTIITTDTAATNVVYNSVVLSHRTTGTPAAGFGVGYAFEVETTPGNNETGAVIEAVITDTTALSEDFKLVFKVMANGSAAVESFFATSHGAIGNFMNKISNTSNLTITAGHSSSVYRKYGLQSGVKLIIESGAIFRIF